MNSFVLKLIACITMFIDHIGYIVFDGPSWFNYIGRLAFPIFAFQISEGYIHTKNIKNYLLRLLSFAIISTLPFILFTSLIRDTFSLNVIYTLFFGLISIIAFNSNKILGVISAVTLGILAEFLQCDYGFYGVFITFLFYVFHSNKLLFISGFVLSTIIKYTINILKYWNFGLEILQNAFYYYLPYLLCTLLSIIIILFYNKKKGPNIRYLLYLFYPLHFLIIYGINYLISINFF